MDLLPPKPTRLQIAAEQVRELLEHDPSLSDAGLVRQLGGRTLAAPRLRDAIAAGQRRSSSRG